MERMEKKENPWDWMQPHDARRLGDVITDPKERARWCNSILVGGLPYLWRHKAAPVRDLMYQNLALRAGDKVFVLGESLEFVWLYQRSQTAGGAKRRDPGNRRDRAGPRRRHGQQARAQWQAGDLAI